MEPRDSSNPTLPKKQEGLQIGNVNTEDGRTPIVEAVATPQEFNIDILARAVAQHETANCKVGTGKYNNCFGIRNGNTAPCSQISSSGFCIYETPEDSYEAFKIIWSKVYGGFPDVAKTNKWTKTQQTEWLNNVTYLYNEYSSNPSPV